MIAAKWTDMVVGVDIHWVLVPAPPSPAPIPTPLPHPFVGIVFDPVGLAVGLAIGAGISLATGQQVTGPVLVNNLPAANTGTEGTNKMVMPHFPTPPGVGWAPVPAGLKPPIPGKTPDPGVPAPVPSNDAIIITGSKTVHVMGTNFSRLGDLAMSCGEPVRLPSSTVIAIPKGPPVLVGGPPALDFLAAILGAIRTSWVSGRLHKIFNAAEGSWRSKVICFLTGHPVDVVSGMLLTDAVDFHLPGRLPFTFERNYCSRSTASEPIGHGWHHSCDLWLRRDPDRVVVHWEDGRQLYFDVPEQRSRTLNRSECASLEEAQGGYLVHTRDGRSLLFAGPPREDGALPVRRIEGADGHRLTFAYDAWHRVQSVEDSLQREVRFEYDESGRLAALWAPDPSGTGPHVAVARFEYDESGDLVAAYDALGNARTYEYRNHLMVRETDRTGMSFYFAWDGMDSGARCVRTWGDDALYDRVLRYAPEKGLTVEEDSAGAVTLHHTNESGLVDKTVDPLGGETLYEWDEWGRPLGETRPNGAKLVFELGPNGRLQRAVDPLEAERSYTWDDQGRLLSMVREGGGEWALEYDRWARPVRVIDPEGGTTGYQYDARGNVTAVTDPRGATTRFRRSEGQGGSLSVETLVGGEPVSELSYDAWGRPVRLRAASGDEAELHWDLAGRIIEAKLTDGRTRRFGYDGEGQLIRIDHPGGDWSEREFFGPGLLRRLRYSGGQTVDIVRDTEGRETEIRAPSGSAHFERDPLGRIVSVRYDDGRRKTYEYVDGGQLVKVRDNLGRATEVEYDLNDRIVRITGWDGYEATFEFDPDGRLTAAENPFAKLEFTRDACGRIVEERRGDLVLRSRYDSAGYRIERSWQWREARGQTAVEWSARGHVVSLDGGSFQVKVERDSKGNPRRIEYGDVVEVERAYDGMGSLVAQVVDSARGRDRQTFRRNPDGQLIERVGEDGSLARFEYDESGWLTSYETDGEAHAVVRSPEGHLSGIGERSLELDEHGRVVSNGEARFEYDDDGCLVRRHGPEGTVRAYDWDSRQRLKAVRGLRQDRDEGDADVVAAYEYDALGRRIAKILPDGTRIEYAWDGLRLVLVEDGSDGKVSEYHMLPDALTPIGRSTEGTVEYYSWDERRLPQRVFDRQGRTTAEGVADAFGHGPSATEWRLPGFVHDEETDLCYGGARYFDPAIARFLTPDPLEPAIGRIAYEYPTDPLGWIDLWALYIIGLGHGRGLDEFAEETGKKLGEDIITYKNAEALPKLPEMATEGWGKWTNELIGQSEAARFNLNGIDDVKAAYEAGKKVVDGEASVRKLFEGMGMDPPNLGSVKGDAKVTHIELYQLLRRDGPLDDSLKKFFDSAGNEVSIDDLRAKCGI